MSNFLDYTGLDSFYTGIKNKYAQKDHASTDIIYGVVTFTEIELDALT